ncbi:MAG TPA: carboxypeptidase-like regulatory domain-containing protein [Polyangiaceae bacterium]|nr:carboxypeptidase-like regulatory domain-containing protein [Polyangiaceae bacterium]
MASANGAELVGSVCHGDEPGPLDCTLTDWAGRFRLESLGGHGHLYISAPGHLPRVLEADRCSHPGVLQVALDRSPGSVSGRVVDGTGGTIEGARVTARLSDDRASTFGAAVTGSNGDFRFGMPEGAIELCADADAYSRVCVDVVSPGDGQVLVLTPASTIVGRVVRGSGAGPLGMASVTLSSKEWASARQIVRADAEGAFSFDGLRSGTYGVVATARGLRSSEHVIELGTGEVSSPFTLVASAVGVLTGQVTVEGAPCARGYLELSGPTSEHVSIGAGGAVLVEALPAGQYETLVVCEGAAPLPGTLVMSQDALSQEWALDALDGPVSDSPSEVAPEVGSIEGTVAHAASDSGPIRIALVSAGTVLRHSNVESGHFLMRGVPLGQYDVYPGDALDAAQHVVIRHADEHVRVALDMPPMVEISGRIVGADGEGVADVWVTSFRAGSLPTERAAPAILTDDRGAFDVPAAVGVAYTLTAKSISGEARLDRVTGPAEVVLRLHTYGSILCSVRLPRSASAQPFTLLYRREDQAESLLVSSNDSSLSIPNVAPGQYQLFLCAGSCSGSSTVVVEAGEEALAHFDLSGNTNCDSSARADNDNSAALAAAMTTGQCGRDTKRPSEE